MTAQEMWLLFKGSKAVEAELFDAWAFGEEPDYLASLVTAGKKTATSSVYDLYAHDNEKLPRVGDYSVILDSNDDAVCVIRTTAVKIVPFRDVDENQARNEGEGDRSLAYWRKIHENCFTRWMEEADMKFSEDVKIVLENFELVFKP